MSTVPDLPEKAIVQRADLVPRDPKDNSSWWRRACDFLRTCIGMRSFDRADRWSEAKVRMEEEKVRGLTIENDIKLTRARIEFEQIEQRFREGKIEAIKAETAAQDELTQAKIRALFVDQLKAGTLTPEEAWEIIQDLKSRIHLAGGQVDIDPPEEDTVIE